MTAPAEHFATLESLANEGERLRAVHGVYLFADDVAALRWAIRELSQNDASLLLDGGAQ